MKKNRIKDMWMANQPTINGWLSMSSAFGSEIMSNQGYDSLTIDLQHGILGYSDCVKILQSTDSSPITPLTRVPWLDPGHIMKALDAGSYGVICPMINTREQAERLVSYTHYPPSGIRSFGPTRALYSLGGDYYQTANDSIICFAMIETAEAMTNLEEIVSTPGLDGVYIGPSDLAIGISDGRLAPGFDSEDPEIILAIKAILKSAKKANIFAGLHCGSAEYAARAIEWGFNMTTISSDGRLLADAASESIMKVKKILKGEMNIVPRSEKQREGY